MNAAIRAVVRAAIYRDWNVVGIRRGYAGLLEEDFLPLFRRGVGGIIHRGGTMLRTARCAEFKEREARERAISFLRRIDVEALVVIGGDGSMAGAAGLTELGFPTVTLPATIDNDMAGTDLTIGFDTAVNTIVSAVNAIRDTAYSHERIAVVEVMGRHAGHLALAAGVACGAETALIPELPVDMDVLIERLESGRFAGKKHGVVLVAEGAMRGADVVRELEERTTYEPSLTVLGYIQRGGAPTAQDNILAAKMGELAIGALEAGAEGELIGARGAELVRVPYAETAQYPRKPDMDLYRLMYELSN